MDPSNARYAAQTEQDTIEFLFSIKPVAIRFVMSYSLAEHDRRH
jgi:hypothetical protein